MKATEAFKKSQVSLEKALELIKETSEGGQTQIDLLLSPEIESKLSELGYRVTKIFGGIKRTISWYEATEPIPMKNVPEWAK